MRPHLPISELSERVVLATLRSVPNDWAMLVKALDSVTGLRALANWLWPVALPSTELKDTKDFCRACVYRLAQKTYS